MELVGYKKLRLITQTVLFWFSLERAINRTTTMCCRKDRVTHGTAWHRSWQHNAETEDLLLAFAWQSTKNVLDRRTLKQPEDYVVVEQGLKLIKKYVAFEEKHHVSSGCMHVVRNRLELIWCVQDEEQRILWQTILKISNVYHFRMNNTLEIMHRHRTDVADMLRVRTSEATKRDGSTIKSLLYGSTAKRQNNVNGEKSVLKATNVHMLFSQWLPTPNKVTKSLYVKFDNLLYTLCCACACHIVSAALDKYHRVGERLMAGFIRQYIIDPCVNVSIPIIGSQALIRLLKHVIVTNIHAFMPGNGVSGSYKRRATPNITKEAMDLFMAYVRYIISSALSGLFLTFDSSQFSGRVWCQKIKDSIDTYLTTYHTNANKVDDWPIENEHEDAEYGVGGLLLDHNDIYFADSEDE